jgi:hypothetical protein
MHTMKYGNIMKKLNISIDARYIVVGLTLGLSLALAGNSYAEQSVQYAKDPLSKNRIVLSEVESSGFLPLIPSRKRIEVLCQVRDSKLRVGRVKTRKANRIWLSYKSLIRKARKKRSPLRTQVLRRENKKYLKQCREQLEIRQQTSFPIRINAGGENYTDSQGQLWNADSYYNGGSMYETAVVFPIFDTEDSPLYKTERYASLDGPGFGPASPLSYNIPVPNGTYEVTLHFAEIFWDLAETRVFDVQIENSLVESAFDIFALYGQFRATQRTYTVLVEDWELTIDFLDRPGFNYGKISALEVHPSM